MVERRERSMNVDVYSSFRAKIHAAGAVFALTTTSTKQ